MNWVNRCGIIMLLIACIVSAMVGAVIIGRYVAAHDIQVVVGCVIGSIIWMIIGLYLTIKE